MKKILMFLTVIVFCLSVTACKKEEGGKEPTPTEYLEPTYTATPTISNTPTNTPTSTPTNSPTPTFTPTPTPLVETEAEFFTYEVKKGEVIITGIKTDFFKERTELVIPKEIAGKKVTAIGEEAFMECTELEAVVLQEGIVEIGIWAFTRCTNLKYVELPDTLTTIGRYSFYQCTGLESIDIPESLAGIGVYAFAKSGLTSIVVPGGISIFGKEVFTECQSLEKVVVCEGITSIPEGTFSSCKALKEVELPEGLAEIEDFAFAWCEALEDIQIPESVIRIGVQAFNSCPLTNIVLPENLQTIGRGAFAYCKFKAIRIPEKTVIDDSFYVVSTQNFPYGAVVQVKEGSQADTWLKNYNKNAAEKYQYKIEYYDPILDSF